MTGSFHTVTLLQIKEPVPNKALVAHSTFKVVLLKKEVYSEFTTSVLLELQGQLQILVE